MASMTYVFISFPNAIRKVACKLLPVAVRKIHFLKRLGQSNVEERNTQSSYCQSFHPTRLSVPHFVYQALTDTYSDDLLRSLARKNSKPSKFFVPLLLKRGARKHNQSINDSEDRLDLRTTTNAWSVDVFALL